jgi:hypothetical protein
MPSSAIANAGETRPVFRAICSSASRKRDSVFRSNATNSPLAFPATQTVAAVGEPTARALTRVTEPGAVATGSNTQLSSTTGKSHDQCSDDLNARTVRPTQQVAGPFATAPGSVPKALSASRNPTIRWTRAEPAGIDNLSATSFFLAASTQPLCCLLLA